MKPKPKRRTWRWVTRASEDGWIFIWESLKMPIRHKSKEGTWFNGPEKEAGFSSVSLTEFLSLFGFVPAPGECCKVYFSGRKGR